VLDLADGSEITIAVAITVDTDAGEILVDYTARRRPARPASTSCATTPTPTRPSRSAASSTPSVPNNHGSLAPIKVEAPAAAS
jgi:N-methylhydantoinase B